MFWKDSPEHETGEVTRAGHPDRGVLPSGRRAHREGRDRSRTPSGCCSGITRRASRRATAARSCTGSTTWASAVREKLTGSEDPQGPADARSDVGLPARRPARRARRRAHPAGDLRSQGRRLVSIQLRRARGGRIDHLRVVDPLRDISRRRQPGGAQEAAEPIRTGSRTSGAGRGRRTHGSFTTARPPTPTATPGPSASDTYGGIPRPASGRASVTRRTSRRRRRRTTSPMTTPRRSTRSPATSRSSLHPDGRGWLYAPTGLVDGPLPAHYEPQETPFSNSLYAQQQNPTRQVFHRPRESLPPG